MIEAHGAKYQTVEQANARIAELNEENLRFGASDGRVTEILLITEAMQAAGWEQTPREAATPKRAAGLPTLGELTLQYINEARKELAAIKRTGYDDGKWRYLKVITPEGRTITREYKTQKGFLTAYIREASRGSDILIAVISGWLTQEQFLLWLGFAGTVLATPIGALAAANTPNK